MLETANREIYWNLPHVGNKIALYIFLIFALIIFLNAIAQRFILYFGNQQNLNTKNSTIRFGFYINRLKHLYNFTFKRGGVNKKREVASYHTLILYGFLVLTFTTTMVFIDYDFGIKIYHGKFYLWITALSDIFGVLLMIGCAYAYKIRYLDQPDRLNSAPADKLMIFTLILLCLQGYILEGIRIVVTDDPWKFYSPIGYITGSFFSFFGESTNRIIHFSTWWIHALSVFVFIALIPYTKFFHIIASPANIFFTSLNTSGARKAKGDLSYPGDVEQLIEEAAESESGDFKFGISTISDLNWKQRLDLDACTSCGRCQEVCPAYLSDKVLSPKWLILDTRNHLLTLNADHKLDFELDNSLIKKINFKFLKKIDQYLTKFLLLNSSTVGKSKFRSNNKKVQDSPIQIGESADHKIAGEVMDQDVFWSCTTCRACMEVCPVGVEHVDYIIETRRSLALIEGTIPHEAQNSLRAIETRGNPLGPSEERANWIEGLNVKILKEGDTVDVIYWVGCVSSYDKRKQNIAKALTKILNASGLSWGILGNLESCTGDPARRLGEENIFQTQAKKNVTTLANFNFKKIISNCPHCFNTLKNEYHNFGDLFQENDNRIIHHTQFIQELLSQKTLKLKESNLNLTFHDPCYLGRYNDEYDAPRDILVQLGSKPKEMLHSREKGLCCGAGGGHFWMDLKAGERINSIRANEAIATNADTIATGCPFCLQMMEDGVKINNKEDQIDVKDIAEIVADNIIY